MQLKTALSRRRQHRRSGNDDFSSRSSQNERGTCRNRWHIARGYRASRSATWAIGGWMWGGTDEAEFVATIRAAVEQGINIIDTAPVYGFGRSERNCRQGNRRGRSALRSTHRHQDWSLNARMEGYSVMPAAVRILPEVEESLRRLRTDHIDIYQIHWPDPLVSDRRNRRGDAYAFQAGKDSGDHRRQQFFGQPNGAVPPRCAPACLQPPYNLFERGIEADILPYCHNNKIATLGYGALCRGLLSGRMRPDTVFDGDDLRRADPKF